MIDDAFGLTKICYSLCNYVFCMSSYVYARNSARSLLLERRDRPRSQWWKGLLAWHSSPYRPPT